MGEVSLASCYLYGGLYSLNAFLQLCYAGVVSFEKGERRIRLLSEARAVRNLVGCADAVGPKKLPG